MTVAYLVGVAVCWMVLTVVSFAAKDGGEMDPVAAHGAAPLGLAMVWPLVGLFAVWLACRAIGVRLRRPASGDGPELLSVLRSIPEITTDDQEEHGMTLTELQQVIGGEL